MLQTLQHPSQLQQSQMDAALMPQRYHQDAPRTCHLSHQPANCPMAVHDLNEQACQRPQI